MRVATYSPIEQNAATVDALSATRILTQSTSSTLFLVSRISFATRPKWCDRRKQSSDKMTDYRQHQSSCGNSVVQLFDDPNNCCGLVSVKYACDAHVILVGKWAFIESLWLNNSAFSQTIDDQIKKLGLISV